MALVMPLAEQRGGAELMFLHLLREGAQSHPLPYIVAFLEDGPMVEEVRGLGYTADVIPAGRLRQPVPYVRALRALTAWLRRHRPQAVLSWMAKAHLYVGPAALLAGVPAFWFQHVIPEGHWIDRLATRLPARGVLCCSSAAEQAQRKLAPVRPTTVVHPAVDLAAFDTTRLPAPAVARETLGLPRSVPLVGMVARLQRWKGVHVFLEAATEIHSARPDAEFVVVGGMHRSEPGYPAELAAQVERSGLSPRVHFVGYQADVPRWIQAMDVLVHASVEPEPFGMVILEGLALGKGVVATDAGGPREILIGDEGRLVPPNDAEALARGVLELLTDPPKERSARSRERAGQFGTPRLARSIVDALAHAGG